MNYEIKEDINAINNKLGTIAIALIILEAVNLIIFGLVFVMWQEMAELTVAVQQAIK